MENNSREVKYILEIDPIIPLSNHKFATIDFGENSFVFGLRLISSTLGYARWE